jgi:ferrous iron transport protein B
VAAVAEWLGVVAALGRWLAPAMQLFALPPDTGLAVVLASIRKDGVLILVKGTSFASLSPLQVLTATYLAGVLTPCLVTLLAVARETNSRFAARLLAKQAVAALVFSVIIARVGALFYR